MTPIACAWLGRISAALSVTTRTCAGPRGGDAFKTPDGRSQAGYRGYGGYGGYPLMVDHLAARTPIRGRWGRLYTLHGAGSSAPHSRGDRGRHLARVPHAVSRPTGSSSRLAHRLLDGRERRALPVTRNQSPSV